MQNVSLFKLGTRYVYKCVFRRARDDACTLYRCEASIAVRVSDSVAVYSDFSSIALFSETFL